MIAVVIASYPCFTDYFIAGQETMDQALRIETFDGSSFFSWDAFLLLPVLFRKLGLSMGGALQWTVILGNVLTAVIAYVSFRNALKSRFAAVAGALIYVVLPWRLGLCYEKGEVDVFMALCFLPLLANLLLLVRNRKKLDTCIELLETKHRNILIAICAVALVFASYQVNTIAFTTEGRIQTYSVPETGLTHQ